MNEEKDIDNSQLLRLLKERKVADSYQFFEACCYKIYLADISYEALKNIIENYQKDQTEIIEKVYQDAKEKGKSIFKTHKNTVNFCGVEIDTTVAIDKLTMEVMGLLHNFFDTFGQWINSSLLGEEAIPIKNVSLGNTIKEIKKHTEEFKGEFIKNFINLLNSKEYMYISDFNNTLKHRYQIYIENKFDILKIKGDINVPKFKKDGRVHSKEQALLIIEKCLIFCKNIFYSSKQFIISFYSKKECRYTKHRIYNPKTFLLFENNDDWLNLRNPQNHYNYIEVDPKNILKEYQIMLVHDSSEAENDKDKCIKLYNCIYPVIMLCENVGDKKIIGILKPKDDDVFLLQDEHNLIYRKYMPKLSGYEVEMSDAICTGPFTIIHIYLMQL